MIRRLPMRCAKSAWPTVLLILCAPVFALQEYLRAAELSRQAFRRIQGRWPAHVLRQVLRKLTTKIGVFLELVIQSVELIECVKQGFGDEPAPIASEVAIARRRLIQVVSSLAHVAPQS
jgi:hypothetical protein